MGDNPTVAPALNHFQWTSNPIAFGFIYKEGLHNYHIEAKIKLIPRMSMEDIYANLIVLSPVGFPHGSRVLGSTKQPPVVILPVGEDYDQGYRGWPAGIVRQENHRNQRAI